MDERWHAGPVAVLGAGTMGRGITQLLLQAGATVTLVDPVQGAGEAARDALAGLFERLSERGRIAEQPDTLLARLTLAPRLPHGSPARWVFEAAPEELGLKRGVLAEAEALAPAALLATNTSTLSIAAIASACREPARVVGVHFFNPAPLMPLVEVVPHAGTSAAVTAAAVAVARSLGRTPVVARDLPGFIVNRLARPYYLEAIRLAAEGGDVATIDACMRAAGFRMGPFELLDLIGLDVNLAASVSVYEAFFHEPRYRPHPLQKSLVAAGRLGRKAGQGFYRYVDGQPVEPQRIEPEGASSNGGSGAPRARVNGSGPLPELLRGHFAPAPSEAEAEIVLHCAAAGPNGRAAAGPDRGRGNGPLHLTLCWGRSAPLSGVGFSVVPPPTALSQLPADEGAGPSTPLTFELLAGRTTASADIAHAKTLLGQAGISTLVVADQPGGVAFRLVAGLINEAVTALAEGVADADTLDLALRLGVNYPAGPLAWAMALGLPQVAAALEGLASQLGAARYAPHPLLRRHAASGAQTWEA